MLTATTMSPTRNAVGRKKNAVDRKTYSGRVAIRIRDARERAGLDVPTVAKAMTRAGYEISPSTLYGWENGTRQPPLDAMPFLARALKVNAGSFFPMN